MTKKLRRYIGSTKQLTLKYNGAEKSEDDKKERNKYVAVDEGMRTRRLLGVEAESLDVLQDILGDRMRLRRRLQRLPLVLEQIQLFLKRSE
uniref:Uncharacterized protein n=1 Tax=Plectus sambesii TaxID=2011161 RepID=A0A914V854_9BILA